MTFIPPRLDFILIVVMVIWSEISIWWDEIQIQTIILIWWDKIQTRLEDRMWKNGIPKKTKDGIRMKLDELKLGMENE